VSDDELCFLLKLVVRVVRSTIWTCLDAIARLARVEERPLILLSVTGIALKVDA
jgi:hypothetical protein